MDGGFQNDGGLFDEHLRQFAGELNRIKTAPAQGRQTLQQGFVNVRPHAHGGKGDPVGHHGADKALEISRLGLAIGQHDAMFERCFGALEHFVGAGHRRMHDRTALGVNTGHIAHDGAAVRGPLQRRNFVECAVKRDHRHIILIAQRGQGPDGRGLGHLHLFSLHAARTVNHQRQRAVRQHFLAVQFHAHGQRVFQGRAAVTARRKRLVTAHAHQPHTKIPHRALQQPQPVAAQIARAHVAEEDGIVALQCRQ